MESYRDYLEYLEVSYLTGRFDNVLESYTY